MLDCVKRRLEVCEVVEQIALVCFLMRKTGFFITSYVTVSNTYVWKGIRVLEVSGFRSYEKSKDVSCIMFEPHFRPGGQSWFLGVWDLIRWRWLVS